MELVLANGCHGGSSRSFTPFSNLLSNTLHQQKQHERFLPLPVGIPNSVKPNCANTMRASVTNNATAVLEKELKFIPTFDKYIEAMEILKEGKSPQNKGSRRAEKTGDGKKSYSANRFNGAIGENFLENDDSKANLNGSRRKENVVRTLRGRSRTTSQTRETGLKAEFGNVKRTTIIGTNSANTRISSSDSRLRMRANGLDRNEDAHISVTRKPAERIGEHRRSSGAIDVKFRQKAFVRSEAPKEEQQARAGRNMRGVAIDDYNTFLGSVKRDDMNQTMGRLQDGTAKTMKKKSLEDDVIHDSLGTERAAFKSFEVFTDVRNKPRMLRMELEERIQKLAHCLNGTSVNLPGWQFSRMLHSAQIKFTDHSILRIVQILGEFGNWRRALQIIQWLESRERFKSYKSRYIYTSVLSVLGKARRPVESLNIFHSMRQRASSYPDLAAYHCIAVTLGQAGHLKELFDVVDLMQAGPQKNLKHPTLDKWDPRLEPDTVIYNAVLNACVQRKQWEGAFWVLQQLKQKEIRPSGTTYGLIMEVMLTCGKFNLVHEFFRKVEKASVANTLTYKVLVNALWREGKTDEAILAVQDMEGRGIVGSASLYYDLARCLCNAGRCQEALQQVDKICRVAKKPLVVTYTGLIKVCLDAGSIKDGVYMFNHMCKFCSPNLITCNMMLKAYVEHGRFEDATNLFWKVFYGKSFVENVSCQEKIIPDKVTFSTVLKACAEQKKWDDFENIYRKLLLSGYQFDVKRHIQFIIEASKAGKGQLVDTTWDQLVQSGQVPPPPLIKEKFCRKLQQEDCVGALACFNRLPGGSPDFSRKTWSELLKTNSHRFRTETLVRLVNELVAQSNPSLQMLLSCCRDFIASTASSSSTCFS